MLAQASFHTE